MTRTRSPKAPTRAALYVRLSEDSEASTSVARQREITAAYAASREWEIVDTFEDIDVSATHSRLDRPGLNRLREAIARDEIDVVIVWRLDRLARKVLDLLTLLDEWTRAGCAAASATESIDLTTPQGRAMTALIGIFAEMEAEAIRARVTGSIDALRHSRRFAGGTVPYGYRTAPALHGPGRILVIVPEEAAVIREAADRLLAHEAPYRVCMDLNTREVASPRSAYRRVVREGGDVASADRGTWRVNSLRRTMTSDHLAGRVTHRGDLIRGLDGLALAVWSPILDGGVIAALRGVLLPTPSASPRPKNVRKARLLSGLVRCAVCGSKMYVRSSNGRPIYGCAARQSGVSCPSPRVMADTLEAYVVADVLALLGAQRMTETVAHGGDTSNSAAVAHLADVEEVLRKVATDLLADDADAPALLARMAMLKVTRANLRAEVEAAPSFHVIRETGVSFAEAYAAAPTVEAQRAILAAEVAEVRISPMLARTSKLDPDRVEIVPVIDDPSVPAVA
jgi:DNA invertase Pin-like site-specific DNA recombinase